MKPLFLACVAACAFSACQPAANTTNNAAMNTNVNANANANANANRSTAAAAAPTKDSLLAMDKSAYEAWKSKNASFWDPFLSQNFIGYNDTGRMDRAAAMKQYTGTGCDVKSYSMSDDQMTSLGQDAAVISYKVTQDGTCEGKKLPPAMWAATTYVREGDKWKCAFHAETPVTDPNAAPPKSSAPAAATSGSTASDSTTDALMAVEKQGWEAWKNRDPKAVESVMSSDFVYLSGTGRKPHAEAVKAWSEPKCQGLDYSFSDPKSVTYGNDAALVTYNAEVKGTCDGKPVTPHIWVASFDSKTGAEWKNAFYMDSPR